MKSAIARCGTVLDESAPLIELSVADTIAVRRFAMAAQKDFIQQIKLAARDTSLKPYEFNDMKGVASVIGGWLSTVIETCNENLANVKVSDQD